MGKEAVKIQEGAVVDYTATETIKNGEIIPLTDRIGVALGNVDADESVSLSLEGVFEITATTGDAIAFGDILYFDADARTVTTDSNSDANVKAGIAITAKAKDVAGSVYVKIDM